MVKSTKGSWCQKWSIDNFKDLKVDRLEAEEAWLTHLETLPNGLVSLDQLSCWSLVEDFVIVSDTKSQQEDLRYGEKAFLLTND